MQKRPLRNDNSSQKSVEVNNILMKVQQYCLLVTLHVHYWIGNPQIENPNVIVEEEAIDQQVAPPRWKLMPKLWRTQFQKLETKARGIIGTYSVPFKLRGVYIVPIESAIPLFENLNEVRSQFNEVTDSFIGSYDEWVSSLKTDLGNKLFQLVKKHIPTKKKLGDKFGIEWAIVPMGQPSTNFEDYNVNTLVSEAREAMNKIIADSVETMIKQPREELVEAVNSVVGLVNADKKFLKSSSHENLQKAFNKYRSFANIIDNDGTILNLMKNIEGQLDGITARDINRDEEVRNGLVVILNQLKTEAEDEVKSDGVLNKFKRAINL